MLNGRALSCEVSRGFCLETWGFGVGPGQVLAAVVTMTPRVEIPAATLLLTAPAALLAGLAL
ncbi:MAG: hypothetical protein QXW41_08015 [Fervidicoccaceae archaeon]